MAITSVSCNVSIKTRMSFTDCVGLPNCPTLDFGQPGRGSSCSRIPMRVTMRDRSKNRKPLQKGRNLSIEAIQTIQALKRAPKSVEKQQVIDSKFSRLLKFDMMAILRELLRQENSVLALMVFAEIKKEYWYKPQVSLYAEIISVLAKNNMYDDVDMIFLELKTEKGRLEGKTEGFNLFLETLMSYNITRLAMDCFELMKEVGCEPDRSTFKLLVSYLESKGERSLSESIRQEAWKYYGDSIEYVDEQDEMATS
ncbi:protein THYLAKOID ASSEMBLY 8, chloroplastic [Lactuca sativa]|uniref:Pentacotripeptide-repeat region of PRORP domain-containing protein n=1 Tax=Lactuca sativa TaxID=4236 RepID=A0A9R1XFM9_LACSA|nr:protein THYLAKOID ASSEMBLY 8, chloroplastic [Lactuca sativa]KAJ0212875.1 hypothetical protein LSAT_V11C400184780 [Lactuca sativa]